MARGRRPEEDEYTPRNGDLIIFDTITITQEGIEIKRRPGICLRKLPGNYQQFLVCGISSQTHRCIEGFDEIVKRSDDNLEALRSDPSVIRLGFLSWVPIKQIEGSIGSISKERHRRLLERLSKYLGSVDISP